MADKKCSTCKYSKYMTGSNNSFKACHYALDTGKLRDCPPQECNKYEKKEPASAATDTSSQK